ncbi:uncharacterized protein LOC114267292 isoform X2 [Camellia sinensis]|uniref:uncharacterized protein LOC114267292 isoform X2 n=1 Tax=Camellia sinensis TaxID=4442 RepID=UPI001035F4D4|nr:uncharacterized protein LOC114267292 isoform X2 [Camellia sinensis]
MLFWCNQKQNTKAKLCPPLHAQQLLPAALTVITGAIPTRIIFLTALETTKAATLRLVEPFKLSEPTQAATANGVAGMAAAVCSQAIFVPIDVVMGHEKKHTVREVVKGLVADDGWKGLYRGLGPRFFTMSAWGTLMILSYEYLSRDFSFTLLLYSIIFVVVIIMQNDEIAKTFVDLIIVNYCIGKFKPNACV